MVMKNVNNIIVPGYLNEEFFVQTLEEGLREENIKIDEINFEWGSNPGENYCSSIYRVLVTFERYSGKPLEKEQLSLIVKTIPITPKTQFLQDVGVFIKEKVSYVDVLPKMEILANDDKFGANYFYAVKQPVHTIVFNDLKVDGFTIASRQDGLDWNHCELILQQLAKFHATSMVLVKKNPAIINRYKAGMLSAETVIQSDTFELMFGGNLSHLISVISSWPGYENITQKLQHYRNNFKDITSKLAMAKSGDRFNALNHGDLWVNNFMFAYGDANAPKKPTKAIFVDFQLSFYGSPACDLNFLLNNSVKLDLLIERRQEMIELYYKTFSETLQYLRYDNIPTLDDLNYELRSRELYGLFGLYGFLPMVTMPKELSEDSSIEAMQDKDFQRKKLETIFTSEKLQAHFRYSLKRLEQLGVFDDF